MWGAPAVGFPRRVQPRKPVLPTRQHEFRPSPVHCSLAQGGSWCPPWPCAEWGPVSPAHLPVETRSCREHRMWPHRAPVPCGAAFCFQPHLQAAVSLFMGACPQSCPRWPLSPLGRGRGTSLGRPLRQLLLYIKSSPPPPARCWASGCAHHVPVHIPWAPWAPLCPALDAGP